MSKQQTAVQWLENQIISELDKSQNKRLGVYFIRFMELVKQTKAMEKQQIIEAFKHGELPPLFVNYSAEQYYNETYGE